MKISRISRGVPPRLMACAGALVTAVAIAAATAPAAGAAATTGSVRSSVPAAQGLVASGAAVKLAPITLSKGIKRIVCEMVFIGANGGAPHHSGHVPGTVNVRVRVTCDKPIARIKATVALFSTTGSKINPYGSVGRATARGNAALVCRTGDYQGVSEATLTAPPGYSPHTAKIHDSTARVHIDKKRNCK
jgi:hypothetical protein